MSSELLDIARRIAADAAQLARTRRAEGVSVLDTKSSPVDVVTAVDQEVERFIRSRLADLRPGDGFFGEESDSTATESGVTWVVDPIDGTVNFLYDLPSYAVSIAAVEGTPDPAEWRALAGCVVNPATGEEFHAAAGGGAHLGDREIRVAPPVELSQALIATGFSYDADRRVHQAEAIARLISSVRDIRRMGAAALDLCSVAAGRVNAYFERALNPWDHAAGALIATEAGATVTGLDTPTPSEEFLLAAHPEVAESLRRLLVVSRV